MIYRAPDLRFPFLSIHLTRETDGRVLAGPNAVLAFGREAYDKEWMWPELVGMIWSKQFRRLLTNPEFVSVAWQNAKTSFSRRAFLSEIQSLVPGVKENDLRPARAGIRAQLVDENGRMVEDVLIVKRARDLQVLNAVSPGLTCSLAFADYVVDQILN
jgi:L-2-hydroxyglutarate oxidase LhgO